MEKKIVNSKLSFEIANIKFCYIYTEEFELDTSAPIYKFLNNDVDYNIVNIITFGNVSRSIETNNSKLRFKTPAWSWYDMGIVQKIDFHPDNVFIGYITIMNDKFFCTKVINKSFTPNPLPVSMTGFLLQLKLDSMKDGFIMHGATVVVNNKCLILTGNSGVGKSTLSSLLRSSTNAKSITDDRFIIREYNNNYYSYGNPFDMKNEKCENEYHKIDAIFFLHHGLHNKIEKLDITAAERKILTICLLPHWNKGSLVNCIKTLKSLVKTIPIYDFHFIPDKSAVEHLNNNFIALSDLGTINEVV